MEKNMSVCRGHELANALYLAKCVYLQPLGTTVNNTDLDMSFMRGAFSYHPTHLRREREPNLSIKYSREE